MVWGVKLQNDNSKENGKKMKTWGVCFLAPHIGKKVQCEKKSSHGEIWNGTRMI
jgi:hypothetical protein